MKRYLLFIGHTYYPAGGWSDFAEDSDDFNYLKNIALSKQDDDHWWHIVDSTTKEVILEGGETL